MLPLRRILMAAGLKAVVRGDTLMIANQDYGSALKLLRTDHYTRTNRPTTIMELKDELEELLGPMDFEPATESDSDDEDTPVETTPPKARKPTTTASSPQPPSSAQPPAKKKTATGIPTSNRFEALSDASNKPAPSQERMRKMPTRSSSKPSSSTAAAGTAGRTFKVVARAGTTGKGQC